MLGTSLQVLQLNIMKSGPRMEALINNHQSQNMDILLVQEPSVTTYQTHINHSAWRLYRPTVEGDTACFRSLVYVNQRVATSSHRQIACNHPNLSDQDLDSQLSDPSLFSIHPTRADAHTQQSIGATGTHSHPEHHNNGSPERLKANKCHAIRRFQPPPSSMGRQPHTTPVCRGCK